MPSAQPRVMETKLTSVEWKPLPTGPGEDFGDGEVDAAADGMVASVDGDGDGGALWWVLDVQAVISRTKSRARRIYCG